MAPPDGVHVRRLAVERNALHRRLLVNPGAAFGGRLREAETRTIRIDRRTLTAAKAKGASERDLAAHRACVERRGLEAGIQTCFLLLLQARDLLGREGHRQGAVRFQVALDIQPAQQGRKIQGCPAPRLKRVARQTNAHQLLELDEPDTRVLGDPSRDGASRTLADPTGFDQRDLNAGGGERIGRRASGQSASDDDDVGTEWPFVPRIGRHARTGKPIEERRPAVVNHRLRILCSAAGRAALGLQVRVVQAFRLR